MKLIKENHHATELGYHLVFCTKFRHKVLNETIQVIVKQLVAQICVANDWQLHACEVMPDHVHVFVQTGPCEAPANIVRILKSMTAIKVFTLFPKLKSNWFWGTGLWSSGYYAGTAGTITNETIKRYIENQKSK